MKQFLRLIGALSFWELIGRYPVTAGVLTILGVGGGVVASGVLTPPAITPQPSTAFGQARARGSSRITACNRMGERLAHSIRRAPRRTPPSCTSRGASIPISRAGNSYQYALGQAPAAAACCLRARPRRAVVQHADRNFRRHQWHCLVAGNLRRSDWRRARSDGGNRLSRRLFSLDGDRWRVRARAERILVGRQRRSQAHRSRLHVQHDAEPGRWRRRSPAAATSRRRPPRHARAIRPSPARCRSLSRFPMSMA